MKLRVRKESFVCVASLPKSLRDSNTTEFQSRQHRYRRHQIPMRSTSRRQFERPIIHFIDKPTVFLSERRTRI